MAHLLYLFFKLNGLFFSLLFKRLNLIIGFISVLIGIIGPFNNISHFFSFLVQLTFKLLIKIVENDSFLSQRVNDMFKIPVDRNSFVILLISFIEPIFKNFDLFLKVILIFRPWIDTDTVFLFFYNFFLEISNVNIDVILDFLFLLNRRRYLG